MSCVFDDIKDPIPNTFKDMEYTKKKLSKDQWKDPDVEETSEEKPMMIKALKRVYKENLSEIEKLTLFEKFYASPLTDAYFEARPCVLLIGQYSVGKTTFIRYLLERDFPGMRVGPEPTTDRFMCLMWAAADKIVPGNAFCADKKRPFTQLAKFGSKFLEKFEGIECDSPILKKISLIDTPGILSGEKQTKGRGYDFPDMCNWFAGRCARILILFDAHKLDISDEMKKTIDHLGDNDNKIRVVLNKADIPTQELIRVYGALMWSLGKVVGTPEVLRVYVGSFWDKPLKNRENQALMMAEKASLMTDLRSLPNDVAVRKVNEVIKRAKKVVIHAQLCAALRSKWPAVNTFTNRKKKTQDICSKLPQRFQEVADTYHHPKNDFPSLEQFKATVLTCKIDEFPKPGRVAKDIKLIDKMLTEKMPTIMAMQKNEGGEGGLSDGEAFNPFANQEDVNWVSWILGGVFYQKAEQEFRKFPKTNSKVSGKDAASKMLSYGLVKKQNARIWTLSDIDEDGWLDLSEWTVCKFMLDYVFKNKIGADDIPSILPDCLIPPNKRYIYAENDTMVTKE